jgi:hypothetical protein
VRENLAALKNAQTCDQDNERSLLLACARTSLDTTCSERIRALVRQSLNWERLGHTAVDHGIFPLLYRALSRDVPDAIPRATLNIWQEIFSRNVAHNLYLVHALGDIMSLLEGQGIRAIPYKGPPLAITVYGDLTLRWAGDLDLLVHPRDYERIKSVLFSEGYQTKHFHWYESEFLHPTRVGSLDIHRGAVPRRYRFLLRFDELWERRMTMDAPSHQISFSTFCFEDLLIILSLELIKDIARPPWLRLVKITDIAELMSRIGITDWSSFIDRLRYVGLHRVVYFALLAAYRMYGTPLPADILPKLKREPRLSHLVDEAILLLFLEDRCRQDTYFHEFKTILSMHGSWRNKAVVSAYFISAKARSYASRFRKR